MNNELKMLELKNVTKIYKTKAGDTRALDGLSLTLPKSGLVFLTGKSGSGKTTLLNVIGGLDGFDEGELILDGKSFASFKDEEFQDDWKEIYKMPIAKDKLKEFISEAHDVLGSRDILWEENKKRDLVMVYRKK